MNNPVQWRLATAVRENLDERFYIFIFNLRLCATNFSQARDAALPGDQRKCQGGLTSERV